MASARCLVGFRPGEIFLITKPRARSGAAFVYAARCFPVRQYHTSNFIGSSRSSACIYRESAERCRYDVRQTAALLGRESRANGPDLTYNGPSSDVFITKVKPDGTGLLYSGYIGGAACAGTGPFAGDVATGLAVDGAGNAYVSGTTRSDQNSFSVVVGPDLTYNGGDLDVLVARSPRSLDLQR